MNDILSEVLSDKNEERKVFYFKKALPIIGIITLIVIVCMVINNVRMTSKERYNIEMGDTLAKSLDNLESDPKTALEVIRHLMNNAENHVKDIAALQMIAMNISGKDKDYTLEILQKVISGEGYLELTQNYAKLMWLSIVLDNKKALDLENQKLVEKYFTSFESDDAPFYGSANILKALYYKDTNKEKAVKILEKIISSKKVGAITQDEARAIIANMSVS